LFEYNVFYSVRHHNTSIRKIYEIKNPTFIRDGGLIINIFYLYIVFNPIF
jgi:hypothetical protein